MTLTLPNAPVVSLVQPMPCDAVTLGDWFEANGLAELVGGATYLVELANATPSAANIGAYADIVREKSILRQLIDAGTETTEDGYQPEGRSVQEVLESAEQRVFKIAESGARGKKDTVSMREAVKDAFRILSERYENRGQLTGISTGFTDLDELTSGLQPSDLIIVAARPSMGKTAFSVNIAEAAALGAKKAVAIFSMEMSASQLAFRMHRLGFPPERVAEIHARLSAMPGIDPEVGLLTHFSESEEFEGDETRAQIRRFNEAVKDLSGPRALDRKSVV